MRQISKLIVKCRILILIIGVALLVPAVIGIISTRINYDILYYLPDDIETMKGQDILLNEFGKGAYGIFICEGMNDADMLKMTDKIKSVDHVAEVLGFDELTGGMLPIEMLPDNYRKIIRSEDGNASLLFIFFDTTSSADETLDAIEDIRDLAGEQCFLSSMSAIAADTKNLVESEMGIYTLIAAILCLLILVFTTDSFMIPVLFMLSIGMAIIYNLGTNFFKGQISYITMALVAALQLGVTMDYSIFLYHSYIEEKEKTPDKKTAMANAIRETFISVTGSSLTTIAGFLAMCFMTFTLGMDIGIVMAKGVVFGVICCITILPSFIVIFDGAIVKTKHKAFKIPTKRITKVITKIYPIFAIIMLLLWIPALYGNNHVNVYYKLDESLPEYLQSRRANVELEKYFNMNSVSIVLVDKDLTAKDCDAMMTEMKNVDGVEFTLGMESLTGSLIPDDIIPDKLLNKLESENRQMLIVSSEYQVATDEINEQCETLGDIVKKYDKEGMLIGEAAATKDLVRITDRDFKVVSIISMAAIFILILFVLKSVTLPVILVLVIELAIYINMGLAYYTGTTLPFIASVCIGTIQLGATVDYAILMTTRYKKERIGGCTKKEAVQTALSTSINSIFTSAMGFFAATIGVAVYSDVDLIGSLCMLLARGAIISMFVVIITLPTLLLIFDKVICKTTLGMIRIKN